MSRTHPKLAGANPEHLQRISSAIDAFDQGCEDDDQQAGVAALQELLSLCRADNSTVAMSRADEARCKMFGVKPTAKLSRQDEVNAARKKMFGIKN